MIGFDDGTKHHPPSAMQKGPRTQELSGQPRLPGVDAWGLPTAPPLQTEPTVGRERRERRERRQEERYPQVLWLEEILGDDRCIRRTGNISVGGVLFDATVPYPVGTRLCLDIPLPGIREKVRALAEVIAIRDQGQSMAAQFTEFPYGGSEQLRQFLVGQQWTVAAGQPA